MAEATDLVDELRRTLARLDVTLSLATDAFAWGDGAGRLVWCNSAFEKLVGRSRIELVARPLAELLPLERDGIRVELGRHPVPASLRGEPAGGTYALALGEPQTIVDVFVSATRLWAEQESALICVVRDVSEQRRAADESERLNRDLEAANRELEAFSYSVSHDLRTPLRAIDGFGQVLLEDYAGALDERGRHYLDRMRAGAQQMGHLIDDLLTLSRVARFELRPDEVDLDVLAREVVDELRQSDPKRDVEVLIQPSITARGDRALLRVVLSNLLGNAWKFTSAREHALIEVGAERTTDELVVYVRDDGVGFDMAYADKLFAPFQRLHADPEFAGSGVGLATVQRIVRRHGGRVWAEGAVGRGATFAFALPLDASEGGRGAD